MELARAEKSAQRFYSMSAQIRSTRNRYYDLLESTQKGTLDITPYLNWFLQCMTDALNMTQTTLSDVLQKARFWEAHAQTIFNPRQQRMINIILDGGVDIFSSSKWAKITKCSQDTALRDIQDLVLRGVLVKDTAGGRSTHYALKL